MCLLLIKMFLYAYIKYQIKCQLCMFFVKLYCRCMDLSYYPTKFILSNGLSGNSSATSRANNNPRTKFLVTSNPISSTCYSSSYQLSEESSNHQLIKDHYQSSGVLLKGTNATRMLHCFMLVLIISYSIWCYLAISCDSILNDWVLSNGLCEMMFQ